MSSSVLCPLAAQTPLMLMPILSHHEISSFDCSLINCCCYSSLLLTSKAKLTSSKLQSSTAKPSSQAKDQVDTGVDSVPKVDSNIVPVALYMDQAVIEDEDTVTATCFQDLVLKKIYAGLVDETCGYLSSNPETVI